MLYGHWEVSFDCVRRGEGVFLHNSVDWNYFRKNLLCCCVWWWEIIKVFPSLIYCCLNNCKKKNNFLFTINQATIYVTDASNQVFLWNIFQISKTHNPAIQLVSPLQMLIFFLFEISRNLFKWRRELNMH